MDDLQSEETAFEPETIKELIKESVDSIIQNAVYDQKKVGQWTSVVIEQVMKRIQGLNKPFKYIVTAMVMQKNGAGVHTALSCFWDNSSDGR